DQKVGLGRSVEHEQGIPVDIQNPNFRHTAINEFGMHIGKGTEIRDTLPAQIIEQPAYAAEILHPKRHRGLLENAARVLLAGGKPTTGILEGGDIFHYHQHALPGLFITLQNGSLQQNIETATVERVIHGFAVKVHGTVPQLHQLVDVGSHHVVAKDLA